MTSTRNAVKIASQPSMGDELINLDTLDAFIATKFADRYHPGPTYTSDVVQEMAAAGYSTIGDVEKDIDRGMEALNAHEAKRGKRYNAIGATRMSLGMSSGVYREKHYRPDDTDFAEFAHLVAQ